MVVSLRYRMPSIMYYNIYHILSTIQHEVYTNFDNSDIASPDACGLLSPN